MSIDANPLDEQTTYRIVERRPGEPRWLVCEHCDVAARLTPEPSVGLWGLDHADDCPNGGETPPDAVE
jgi:hypothetical protein